MKPLIDRVTRGEDLTAAQASEAMEYVMSGKATDAQIAAYLIALKMKGETVEEITGSAQVMRSRATAIPTQRRPLVDTCGTGGDGAHTFNISTTAAFVVAGAGVPVAKHGNRSVSSQCGSADVLEALGVNLNLSPEAVARCINEIGIGFLYAPALHKAMKHAIGPRREIGVRTVFNILGPLTNPAGADAQVVGVYDQALTKPVAGVLANLESKRAFVVHGAGGLDEISISGPTRVSEVRGGEVTTYEIDPETFGLATAPAETVTGGDAVQNSAITRAVLDGTEGPQRDITILNAAAALTAAGTAADLKEGIERAVESIDSGAARTKLDELVRFSQEVQTP